MLKKILLILVLISFTANAQHSLHGKMKPVKDYSYIILNQLSSVNKKYIANAVVTNGEFKIEIPKGSAPGVYRLEYDVNKNLFIDFFYNNEEIDFEFHPDYPSTLVTFSKSNENKLYQEYLDEISVVNNKLDSVQVKYFQTKNLKENKVLTKIYTKELVNLKKIQEKFKKKSEGKLVKHYIKANKRHYKEELIKDTDEYLKNLKTHYYDNIDFSNEALTKSSFLIDKVMDYVLYLTNSKDPKTLITLHQKAITESLDKIKPLELKNDIMQSILYLFAQRQNKAVTDYIFKNHFNKLPVALQDLEFKKMIKDLFKTTIGEAAPNIKWDVYGKPFSLASLKKSEYYVILFWGSTCTHCLKEVPKFNEFLTTHKNIKALAIGIEDEKSKVGWKEETFELAHMTHILGLSETSNKWDNIYVRDYGITGTPSYFVLDSNKKIIAKPYDFVALQEFFKKLK